MESHKKTNTKIFYAIAIVVVLLAVYGLYDRAFVRHDYELVEIEE